MEGSKILFATQRTRVLDMFAAAGAPFTAATKPYKSTRPVVFDIVDPNPTAAAVMAHARAEAGQVLSFFSYGVGGDINDGFGNQFAATEDDTNLGEANNTEGAEEFVIEGISTTARSARILYTGDVPAAAALADPAVLAAYFGPSVAGAYSRSAVPIFDPGSLVAPPQVQSPFNLENALMSAVAPHLAVVFQWDRRNTEYVGTLDEFPEGGAKSLLRANGDPNTSNRYKVPEGYLWRRQGQPDSHFNVIVTLARPVVVPINFVTTFGAAALDAFSRSLSKIAIDITMRLHGLSVEPLSNN